MIDWDGRGIVGVVIPFAALLAAELLATRVGGAGAYQERYLVWGGAALLLSGPVVWLLGRRWNRAPGRRLIDPDTGEDVVLRRRHAVFWMPLHLWGLLVTIVGAGMLGFAAISGEHGLGAF